MKRMKKIIIGVLALALILLSGFIYQIRPVAKFSDSAVKMTSPKDIIAKEIKGSIAAMLLEKTMDFQLNFSEKDINNMLAWKQHEEKYKNIKGIHCNVQNKKVFLFIDFEFSSFASSQLILKTEPLIEDGNMKITIEEAHLGRVNIPKSWLIKYIEDKYDNLKVDIKNSAISIPIDLPKQITIKDFQVSDGVRFKVGISLKSRQDLIDVLMYLYGKNFDKIISEI